MPSDPLDPRVRDILQLAPGELDALGFYATRQLEDGWWLALEPMTFGRARIARSVLGADTAAEAFALGYDDVWEFPTRDAGLEQLRTWNGLGDPRGWSRHPLTGRRRQPDGSVLVRRRELTAALIEELRADVAAGAAHECDEWWGEPHGPSAGRCVLCDKERQPDDHTSST